MFTESLHILFPDSFQDLAPCDVLQHSHLRQQRATNQETVSNVDQRPIRSLKAQSLITFHFLHFLHHRILSVVGGLEHKFEKKID
jgi:hypothetical protein